MLDPDAPVAKYWPEFAANGKDAITVRQVLSHQAGLPLVDGDFTLDEALVVGRRWSAQLAAQAPIWEPGTKHGYHMRTFGWLVGELVRRVDGRTIGQFLRDEIAAPLGLDFWIGLPEADRTARRTPRAAEERPRASCFAAVRDDFCSAQVFDESRRALQLRRHVEHAAQLHACRAAVVERYRRRPFARAAVRVTHRRGRRRAHVSSDETVAAATAEQACGQGRGAS